MSNTHALFGELRQQFVRLRTEVIRPGQGFLKHPYCVPCGYYQELWDWDGFFIAVHLAGREPQNASYLRDWGLNFLAAANEEGYAAGCLTHEGPEPGHRSFQMKPLLAQGMELAGRLRGDDTASAEHYDAIRRLVTLREKTHYNETYGLFVWDNAMQSGADNNPALSNEPDEFGVYCAADINAFQWREYVALSQLARRLGQTEDADAFAAKADRLRQAVQKHLWCEGDETYWNLDIRTGQFRRRVSYSNFVPLWANMATQDQGQRMIRRYLWNTEHMLSEFGLRTLSKQDPSYNNENIIWPYSNWQGPVWPIANYFYFVGLMNYGFRAEAEELMIRVGRLCLEDIRDGGAMHENYDAETGATMAPTAEQRLNTEGGFVGWNLLLEDMIEMLEGRRNLLELVSPVAAG